MLPSNPRVNCDYIAHVVRDIVPRTDEQIGKRKEIAALRQERVRAYCEYIEKHGRLVIQEALKELQ